MAAKHRVTCINKVDRTSVHERISSIGGTDGNGTAWKLTQAEAIEGIEIGKWQFYVSQAGIAVDVIVSTSLYGNKYLKTAADGVQPDNLLSLPECR